MTTFAKSGREIGRGAGRSAHSRGDASQSLCRSVCTAPGCQTRSAACQPAGRRVTRWVKRALLVATGEQAAVRPGEPPLELRRRSRVPERSCQIKNGWCVSFSAPGRQTFWVRLSASAIGSAVDGPELTAALVGSSRLPKCPRRDRTKNIGRSRAS